MKIAILLFSLLLSASMSAQTSWHGLEFGQTRDQAKAQLASQSFDLAVSQDGMLESVSDYNLYLPGFTNAFPFKVNLHFVGDHLTNIDLVLDVPAMRTNFPSRSGDLLTFAGSHLAQTLAAKYGPPVYRDFSCSAAARTSDCTVSWRGENQSVSLAWLAIHPGLRLRYEALTNEL